MTKFKQVSIENVAGNQINPATTDNQETLNAVIGEAQATPTNTYSLLGRLKNWFTDGLAKLKIWDGTSIASIDPYTSSLYSIDVSHFQTHLGKLFLACDYVSSVSASTFQDWLLITNNKYSHLIASCVNELDGNLYLYELATVSDNGTALNIYNRNRVSSTVSVNTFYRDPTLLTLGNLICKSYIPGKNEIGKFSEGTEFILKLNTIYLFRFESLKNS